MKTSGARRIPRSGWGSLLVAAFLFAFANAETPSPPSPPPSPPATAHPTLVFDATDLELGDVVRGQDALATFTYRNVGDAPLRILSAKPG